MQLFCAMKSISFSTKQFLIHTYPPACILMILTIIYEGLFNVGNYQLIKFTLEILKTQWIYLKKQYITFTYYNYIIITMIIVLINTYV